MSNPDYISSAGGIGRGPDDVNDRYRGFASSFISEADSLRAEWNSFTTEANSATPPATRFTMRAVTTPEAAARAARHTGAEAYIPLSHHVGLFYMADNAPHRQPNTPVNTMNQTVDKVAADIAQRFREPVGRLEELSEHGYHFVDHITDPAQLQSLWGSTFGWTAENIGNLNRRLVADAQREPADRELWFTGVIQDETLVAAIMAERLDVPGPHHPITTIESTEWAVDRNKRNKRAGLATGMVILNTAQCLQDQPTAQLLAECRYSSTAYAAGMSAGFCTPTRQFSPQILARNVWVDGELADFVPLSLPPQPAQNYYSPSNRAAMLACLNT